MRSLGIGVRLGLMAIGTVGVACALGVAGCFGASNPALPDGGAGLGTDAAAVGALDAAGESGPSTDGAVGSTDAGTAACAGDGGSGTFTCTASLSVPRVAPGAAVLASGQVLVAGGWNPTDGTLSTAEIYDPALHTFGPTGSMTQGHLWAGWESPWPVLTSGKVLVAGGLDAAGDLLTGAELYDPTAGAFSATGPLSTAVIAYSAIKLDDGTALFLGGYSAVTVEPPTPAWTYSSGTNAVQWYKPSSSTFTPAGNLAEARLFGCNVLLTSGDVLAIGGWTGATATFESNIELFDATSGQWGTVGTLGNGVTCTASAFLLPNGKILLDGSALLDPSTYSSTPTTNVLALAAASFVQLASGDVLAAGGMVGNAPTARAQVYRVATNMWTEVGAMNFARGGGHRLLALASGDVLVVGGGSPTPVTTSELYHP